MLAGFLSAFRTPDLRKKLLFTLGILAIYRLGVAIPTPGVSYGNVELCLNSQSTTTGGPLQILNLFSGGALLHLSVFALGIMPYITASIMVQLLRVLIPRFEALQKEGADGQAKLTQYTRYITVGFAAIQSASYVTMARNGVFFPGCADPIIPNTSWNVISVMVLTMTAGTVLIMWLGERITERGIGNGMSLLIFTSVASSFPRAMKSIWDSSDHVRNTVVILMVVLAVIAAVVYVEQSQRRIPVQYAKRMVGRKMLGGSSTYIPLKINMAGVIPVIFASSLLQLPYVIVQFAGNNPSAWIVWMQNNLTNSAAPLHMAFYILLDRLLRVLLHGHHLRPHRSGRQHEEVRRLRPRHSARQAHGRLPRLRAVAHHRGGFGLLGNRGADPDARADVLGAQHARSPWAPRRSSSSSASVSTP